MEIEKFTNGFGKVPEHSGTQGCRRGSPIVRRHPYNNDILCIIKYPVAISLELPTSSRIYPPCTRLLLEKGCWCGRACVRAEPQGSPGAPGRSVQPCPGHTQRAPAVPEPRHGRTSPAPHPRAALPALWSRWALSSNSLN